MEVFTNIDIKKNNLKRIIFHVGHAKTGSSYLQSFFSLNSNSFFKNNSIYYPMDEIHEKNSSQGKITSGNGHLFNREVIENSQFDSILFSREQFYRELLISDYFNEIAAKYDVTVFIYTRNIIEHAISKWEQAIKRDGFTEDIDTFLTSHPVGPQRFLLNWSERSINIGFKLIISNYSYHKGDIAMNFLSKVFEKKFDKLIFKYPANRIVNRGLTFTEYEIQRLFNAIFGKKSHRAVSDVLIHEYPNSPSYHHKINSKTFETISNSNYRYLEKINHLLPDDEQIIIGDRNFFIDDNKLLGLSNDILSTLASSIKKNLFNKKNN